MVKKGKNPNKRDFIINMGKFLENYLRRGVLGSNFFQIMIAFQIMIRNNMVDEFTFNMEGECIDKNMTLIHFLPKMVALVNEPQPKKSPPYGIK